jgi:hypothetical protein
MLNAGDDSFKEHYQYQVSSQSNNSRLYATIPQSWLERRTHSFADAGLASKRSISVKALLSVSLDVADIINDPKQATKTVSWDDVGMDLVTFTF